MFFPGSRYLTCGTYTVVRPDGIPCTATRLPLPAARPVVGYRRRGPGERLDLVAYRYLSDATAFWQLCDANNAMCPDALAARPLVGIPAAVATTAS